MKNRIRQIARLIARLHESEQGAEGLEKILILAAVVIPLLGVLLIFRDRIQTWVGDSWESMTGNANITNPDPTVPSSP